MVRKRIAARILAGVMLAAGLSAGATCRAAGGGFTDVAPEAWYAGEVGYVAENGLMSGVSNGLFAPDQVMSRAMLATVLYRMVGSPAVEGQDSFTDTEEGMWYSSAVLWAQQSGYITGYSSQIFGTGDPVTREQMAAILWRYAGSPAPEGSAGFADSASISDWASAAADWASARGIIGGKPGNCFDPGGQATRAEAAVILARYDRTGQPEPMPEPEPEPEPEPSPEVTPPPAPPPGPTDEPVQPEPDPEPEPEPDPEPTSTPLPIPGNPYDSSAFVVNENGFLTYEGDAPSYIGIDVSSYQGKIDWQRVADAGVDFAIIRAGFRGYTVGGIVKDPYFEANMEGALAAGIDVGVYFFSQAVNETEAIEEALQPLEWIEGYDVTYPVVFDWEYVSDSSSRTYNMENQQIIDCTRAFCEVVRAMGYQPMTYSNPHMVEEGYDLSQIQDYPFWLAHYTRDWTPTPFPYYYDIWQYSSDGAVDGIEGRVDLNLCLTHLKNGR